MGQPKFPKKKYETPNHPWQGDRIKAEHELRRKFGLKNKTEIWKAQSRLRQIRGQARELISRTRNPDDTQAAAEAKLLLRRLHREGYVGDDASLNEVLGLDVERILNRRLQSVVYLKGMARTPKQARQFVSHGLVKIGERRVDVPSYVVRRDEEGLIEFVPTAAVADPEHPVRPRAPGQDVVAEARAAPATSASEEPTESNAPAGKAEDQPPTVAPSEGEKAEAAEREAPPGQAPPAAEAKTVEAEAPAAAKEAAAEAEAPLKEAPAEAEPAAETKDEAAEESKDEAAEESKDEAAEESKDEAAEAKDEAAEESKDEATEAKEEAAEESKDEAAEAKDEAAEESKDEAAEAKEEAAEESKDEATEAKEEAAAETKEAEAAAETKEAEAAEETGAPAKDEADSDPAKDEADSDKEAS